MSDVLKGAAELAGWLNTEFAPAAFGYFQHERQLAQWATDYSSLLAPGAKAISIPQSAAVVAESRGASGETAVEYTGKGSDEGAATITVNQFYTAAHLITKLAASQVRSNTQIGQHYIEGTVYALRSSLETYLAVTTIQDGGTTNDVSLGTANTVSTAKLNEGISNLMNDNAYVPGQVVLGMSPEAWAASVADWDDLYFHVSATGGATMLTNGAIGSIQGLPIYVSGDWDGTNTLGIETASLWNKRSIGYGMQNAFDIIGPVDDPTRGGIGFSVELYYGATVILEPGIANFNNPG